MYISFLFMISLSFLTVCPSYWLPSSAHSFPIILHLASTFTLPIRLVFLTHLSIYISSFIILSRFPPFSIPFIIASHSFRRHFYCFLHFVFYIFSIHCSLISFVPSIACYLLSTRSFTNLSSLNFFSTLFFFASLPSLLLLYLFSLFFICIT